jgi:AraC-like DNA-binding protein
MNDNKYDIGAKSSGFDGLSEVLQLLNLDVDIYHNAKVCGNWRIDEHTLGATCFHIVTLGSCRMYVPGNDPMELQCGDLVIFPREIKHRIGPVEALSGEQQHLSYLQAESLAGTGLLCGEVRFQHKGCRFLLDALPAFFIIRNSNDNPWLKAVLSMIVHENSATQPASKIIINRLSELLFTYALRQYLEDNPDKSGMLFVYSDAHLVKAIRCIHASPQSNWTLERLAKEAGLSRTVFAETFKNVSGWTPGQYLIWWRMQIAWNLLRNGSSVSQVAEHVGYQSDSSFSRAFSKTFSISAGKVRRGL